MLSTRQAFEHDSASTYRLRAFGVNRKPAVDLIITKLINSRLELLYYVVRFQTLLNYCHLDEYLLYSTR